MIYPRAPDLGPGQFLHASMWWCGDEVCDCTQPQIELRGPLPADPLRFPQALIATVWEGAFHSEASDDEYNEQWTQLAVACAYYGIECPKRQ